VYSTPPEVFRPLHREFNFELDVCANEENHKTPEFFTEAQDGLRQPWAPRRCWMNPPYGRDIIRWVRKAYEESQKGALVVGLLPASTDTMWWHEWVQDKAELRFVRGRIKFGGMAFTAPHPHAIAVWRAALTDGQRIVKEESK
jgi:site-specific DNA-methyltransferase (adenine-specific)